MKAQGAIFNYNQYMQWLSDMVQRGITSGNKQTPALIEFTRLNHKRMERLNKTIVLEDNLLDIMVSLEGKQIWYVLAEVWCGDCAQILPVIGKISELAQGSIDLRIIQRDENPEWMEKYHTNGSKSVPKLIAFNSFGQELFTWGPRPKEAQTLLINWKNSPNGKTWDDFELELHTWYAKDKTKSIQYELSQLLLSANQDKHITNANFICSN